MGSPMNGKECYSWEVKIVPIISSLNRIAYGNDITPKKGEVNVKKKLYNFMGWVSLIVGAVLFIIPGLPGTPILLLSKYFFSI